MTPEPKPRAKTQSNETDQTDSIEEAQVSPSALEVYGKLLLAVGIPLVGLFFLGMTGFFPLLIVSKGTVGGLAFVGVCAAAGLGICWIGRRSGVMLLIGLLFIGLAVFSGVYWLEAAL